MSERPSLAVLGAINVDLVVSGSALPRPAETVTGGTFTQHHGGKGGNQAVAAARARTHDHLLSINEHPRPGTWMLGAVGDDQLGVAALEALRVEDVQTDHVLVTSEEPTGVALIAVGPEGENQISVAPGANRALTSAHIVGALETLNPDLLLVSMEVPEAAVRAAVKWSADRGVAVVMNPAPWQAWVGDLLALATYVTPNEVEVAEMGAIPGDVVVIETRGAHGVVVHDRDGERTIAAPRVEAVDTTGAGDCFNGVFAARIADGHTLDDAVTDAVVAAALSVTTPGAREGMPDAAAIAAARVRFGR